MRDARGSPREPTGASQGIDFDEEIDTGRGTRLSDRGRRAGGKMCTVPLAYLAALCVVLGIFLLYAGKVWLIGLPFAALLFTRGGYPFAWIGVLLIGATGVRVGPLVISDVFLIPALALAALSIARGGRSRLRLPRPLTGFSLLLLVVTLLTALISGLPLLRVAYAVRLIIIVLGMPLIFAVHGRTRRRFEGLLAAYVLSAAGNGIVSVLDSRGLHWGSRLTGFTGYLFNGGRYPGLTAFTNQLGMLSVLAIPMMLQLARRNKLWNLAALPILAGILVSGSRGAIIGIAVAAVSWAICTRQYRFRVILRFAGLATLATVLATEFGLTVGLDRLLQGGQTAAISDELRLQHAADAIHEIADHPLFGTGFAMPEAHDTYLEILRDGGLVITIPMLVMIAWVFRSCFRSRDVLALGPTAGLLTWAILNVQFNGVYERYLWVPFGAAVALVMWRSRGGLPDDAGTAVSSLAQVTPAAAAAKGTAGARTSISVRRQNM